MKIGTVIQARLGSSRLPGKVLKKIGDKTILERVCERALLAPFPVVVSTPDREIAEIAVQAGCLAHIGDEDNVLRRVVDAAEAYKFDAVVRVNADCPFVLPADIVDIADALAGSDADYATFRLPGEVNAVLTKVGCPEAAKVTALQDLLRYSELVQEHVTFGLYTDRPEFKRTTVLTYRPENLTIDEPGDLERWNSRSMKERLAMLDRHILSLKSGRTTTEMFTQPQG